MVDADGVFRKHIKKENIKVVMNETKEDFKVSWHVKWREHNPVSWFLCWLFEQNYAWMPMFFFYVHDWFCPGYREVKEMAAAAEEDYKAGRFKKARDLVAEK